MLLIDLLQKLTLESAYSGTEAETYVSQNLAFALIEDLYNLEECVQMETGVIATFSTPQTTGWVACNGVNRNRVDFPDLYAVLPAWLIVDADTFTTPNLAGRFVLGNVSPSGYGDTGGSDEHTLTVAEMPSHDHDFKLIHWNSASGATQRHDANAAGGQSQFTEDAGGGDPHNNMPPYMELWVGMKT